MKKFSVIEYARAQISNLNGGAGVNNLLSQLNESGSEEIISIGCSGGSDSVFLVEYVLKNFHSLKNHLLILHFNHNLRGEDSDGDEEFVKALAGRKGLQFYGEKLLAKPKNISEELLRNRRNEFFERALEKFGSQVLLLGHQKNDVAETLLMRLIRSSSAEGLSAPRAVAIFRNSYLKLRPLLDLTKEKIENHLRDEHIQWRDDRTNSANDFLRNKIRNIILPKMQEIAGTFDVIENLAAAKKNIEEASDAVDFFSKKYLAGKNLSGELEVADVKHLPIALVKKIFTTFLAANGFDVRGSYVNTFLKKMIADDRTAFSLGREKFAKFDGARFSIAGKNKPDDWCIPDLQIGENKLPNGRILSIERVSLTANLRKDLKSIDVAKRCYAAGGEELKISAKGYKPNYRYVRFGHSSGRKLGDIATGENFSAEVRKFLPIIFLDDKICWVPGLPVSNFFRIKEEDKEALLLTYF
ncbi:MAG: tRNA lysidine(34) synthetase TilS [Puniceicoccales bacterium]|nr:tRNA lysidine(34) synthetase TilS [Puniceicoccales bacterium]